MLGLGGIYGAGGFALAVFFEEAACSVGALGEGEAGAGGIEPGVGGDEVLLGDGEVLGEGGDISVGEADVAWPAAAIAAAFAGVAEGLHGNLLSGGKDSASSMVL